MKNQSVTNNLDWVSVVIYITLVVMGWLNIYSSSLSLSDDNYIFDLSQFYGKQLLSIVLTIPLIFMVLSVDGKFYEKYSTIIFGVALLSLAGLFVFGKTIKGQANWYSFGSFGLQPSEFAKAATALAIAKYLSDTQVNLKDINKQIQALGIILLPILLIVPHDPGSALIYTIFIIVLYREGLPPWYLWTGFIAIIVFVFSLILEPWPVILISFLVICFIYIKSRIIDRNIVASAITLVLISGFVFSVDYVLVFYGFSMDSVRILYGFSMDSLWIL